MRWIATILVIPALTAPGCEKLDRSKPQVASIEATAQADGEAAPWIEKTAADRPPRERREACLALGGIGGNAARERLLAMLAETTRDPEIDGPTHLYAAAGLTRMQDPGTAVKLLLALSTNNPDDNVASLASEERSEEYYTVDAQICDALLGLGLLEAEEELVQQLRRRHRIRVLIDAYAVLRRRTGKKLPFRYNGSYAARMEDADRWQEWLRETRAKRTQQRPFGSSDALFCLHFQAVVDDLGTDVMNNLLIARKVVARVGAYAIPFLLRSLASDNVTWQREAALMLGRIGSIEASPALRGAVGFDNAAARKNAIDALRMIGDAEAAAIVIDRLGDKDPGVRAAAAGFLGEHGDKDAIPPLEGARDKERLPDTRAAIETAIEKLR